MHNRSGGTPEFFVLGFAALVTYLTVKEYQPDDQERVKRNGTGTDTIREGDSLGVLTFNIGYGALDKAHDFFYGRWKDREC